MKNIICVCLISIILNWNLYSQIYFSPTLQPVNISNRCLQAEMTKLKLIEDKNYHEQFNQMNQTFLSLSQMGLSQAIQASYTIPVVIHIIHNNGSENISDSQVLQGLKDLNDAYSNSGGYKNLKGVKTDIQFCLALQDEKGKPTSGINRVKSTLTNLTSELDDINLKKLSHWDPLHYLNIWLVNEIVSLSIGSSIAGYAYLPASHGRLEDGIVMEARYLGSNMDNSKVLVHEVGHYLGLFHTFEGGCINQNCQIDNDQVCDTPPDNSTSEVFCGLNPNSCSTDDDDLSINNPFRPITLGGLGDQIDMTENYLDYSNFRCMYNFTNGQKNRMISTLTYIRSSLLQSVACQKICNDPLAISFIPSATTIATGAQVDFTNTTNALVNYEWKLNGSLISSGVNFSYTFNSPGEFNVTLVAYNKDRSCLDSLSKIIKVHCFAQSSFTMNPPGPYKPGVTIDFKNSSMNATDHKWFLDGVYKGNKTNFKYTFNSGGGHSVYLVVSDGLCNDTSIVYFFEIGNCNGKGQKDDWFMSGCSIDFSSGTPVIDTSPYNIPRQQCSASISDNNGDLLFFTNGLTVYNRNQKIMMNGSGLKGDSASSQGVLIVPIPASPLQYYVFTVSPGLTNYLPGLSYSIVDMRLDGGLGAVTSTKNAVLLKGIGAKLSATCHANETDIWLVVENPNSKSLLSFLITPNGIIKTPIESKISSLNSSHGSLKFSHDGRHIATTTTGFTLPRRIIYADFDRSSGVVSNPIELTCPMTWVQPYDCEFSPDNSKLYCTMWNEGGLYQWDLSLSSSSAIIGSIQRVDAYGALSPWFGRITLAPNGIIYLGGSMNSNFKNNSLDAILYPNMAGSACGFVKQAIVFSNNTYAWPLPNFMGCITNSKIPSISGPIVVCSNSNPLLYTIKNYSKGDSAVWQNTGDGKLIKTTDSTTQFIPSSSSGIDSLVLTLYADCGLYKDTLILKTNAAPVVELGNDTAICPFFLLDAGSGFTSYLWNTGESTRKIIPTKQGKYFVTVTDNNGCRSSDAINLFPLQILPPVDLGPDTSICLGHTVKLNAGNNYYSYQWQDGWPLSTYTATSAGTYWVKVSGMCYSGMDTIQVSMSESNIPLDLGQDILSCDYKFPIVLRAPQGYLSYLWQDGSTGTTYHVDSFGIYFVIITDSTGCSAKDTLSISKNNIQISDSINITECNSFLWDGKLISSSGTYLDTFKTINGCDSIVTLELNINKNHSISTQISCDQFYWNNKLLTKSGIYYDTLINRLGCDSIAQLILTIHKNNTNEQIVNSCTSYTWNNKIFTQSGIYQDTINTIHGCDSISILYLNIHQPFDTTLSIKSCESYIWNGQTMTKTGLYYYKGLTQKNCDSTIQLNLMIAKNSVSNVSLSVCDSVNILGTSYDKAGIYSIKTRNADGCDSTIYLTLNTYSQKIIESKSACDSIIWHNKSYTQSGAYFLKNTNIKGCDSIHQLNLTIHPSFMKSINEDRCKEYYWSFNNTAYNQSGIYQAGYPTINGCDSVLILNLIIHPEFERSDTIESYSNYLWPINQQNYSKSGNYQESYTNINGCDSIYKLVLIIDDNFEIFAPNIINSNSTTDNDKFTLYAKGTQAIISTLIIYDRWGELLWQKQNFESNNPRLGWDGRSHRIKINPGVYVWYAEVLINGGKKIRLKGDVTLVK
ncbi:MAG: PKD domain-containing protein [Saprospiraceae bacterium]|nr:PKD domain-containing protein [Saprospiraceae bacterium]